MAVEAILWETSVLAISEVETFRTETLALAVSKWDLVMAFLKNFLVILGFFKTSRSEVKSLWSMADPSQK